MAGNLAVQGAADADRISQVIISGESGTGKELVARALQSTMVASVGKDLRRHQPRSHPSAISNESELFGHEAAVSPAANSRSTGRLRAGRRRYLCLTRSATCRWKRRRTAAAAAGRIDHRRRTHADQGATSRIRAASNK